MKNDFVLQLRYLQTLNSISAENNSTIVFPVPIDIMSELVDKKVLTKRLGYSATLENVSKYLQFRKSKLKLE